jgi:hypothetical protein
MEIIRLARDLVAPRNYFSVLGALLVAGFVGPLLTNSWEGRVFGSLFIFLLVVSISSAVSPSKAIRMQVLVLGVCAWLFICGSSVLGIPGIDTPTIKAASYFCGFLFLLLGTFVIFRDVFSGQVTANRICGAICLYLLLGACFAVLYLVVDLVDPHAFNASPPLADRFDERDPRHERLSLLMYFSMVTLSTVGYGDITPVNRVARTLAWVEAVGGQLYLSVMVARLVGLHLVRAQANAANRSEGIGD